MTDKITKFESFLRDEGYSRPTIRSYKWALSDLGEYLEDHGSKSLGQVTQGEITAWLDNLLADGLALHSRSLASAAAQRFLEWSNRE